MRLIFEKLPDMKFEMFENTKRNEARAGAGTWNDMPHVFSAWCRLNGVYIGEGKDCVQISYNSAYHFYDVYLFAILGNRADAQTSHFEKVRELLKNEGVDVTDWGPTYRWADNPAGNDANGKIMVPGVRFWIKPAEMIRDEATLLLQRARVAIKEVTNEPNNTRFFWSAQHVVGDIDRFLVTDQNRMIEEKKCQKTTPPPAPGAETTPKPVHGFQDSVESPTASTRSSKGATKRRSSRVAERLRAARQKLSAWRPS